MRISKGSMGVIALCMVALGVLATKAWTAGPSIRSMAITGGAAILLAMGWLIVVELGQPRLRKLSRREKREKQTADTRKNAVGRIYNALEPLNKADGKQRGVNVYSLFPTEHTVNIFWANEFHSLGILTIEVEQDSIRVLSLDAAAPQGTRRDYRENLDETGILNVIGDARKFIAETYEMAYRAAHHGAR